MNPVEAAEESAKINVHFVCSGLGGRAEERASVDDEDGRGGSDDEDDDEGESCDELPGLIQKARVLSSPFQSHTNQSQSKFFNFFFKQVQEWTSVEEMKATRRRSIHECYLFWCRRPDGHSEYCRDCLCWVSSVSEAACPLAG